MPTIDPVKLRVGRKISLEGQLWIVTDFQHRTPGNLRSFVVCKLKNLIDGRVVERTFRGSADWPEDAQVENRTCQMLYHDELGYHFMDLTTFEQIMISDELLGFQAQFLAPEAEVIVCYWNDRPVGIELPPKMVFKVVDTVDSVDRGNSSGNIMKDATLDNGLTVQVPAFIKRGEKIRVSTEDGSYVERA